jgi:hypothetical protein
MGSALAERSFQRSSTVQDEILRVLASAARGREEAESRAEPQQARPNAM